MVELICEDEKAAIAVSIVIGIAKPGDVGVGKIFVLTVGEAIRIRTEEFGNSAL